MSAEIDVEAVRASLLAAAAVEAADARAAAHREDELRLGEARAHADELVAAARRLGESDADLAAASRRIGALRQARALSLEARREAFETFRQEALDAILALRGTPAYEALLQRLAAAARAQLGEEATLEIDPPSGGVVGHAGPRHVDYSLPALVDRCILSLGSELEELWS